MTVSEDVSKRRDFVRQFSVMMPNRVGAFSSLSNLLSRREIDVIGLSVQDSRDATVARLIVNDPDSAEELFMEQGIAYTLSELLVVKMKECGDLKKCLNKLTHNGQLTTRGGFELHHHLQLPLHLDLQHAFPST